MTKKIEKYRKSYNRFRNLNEVLNTVESIIIIIVSTSKSPTNSETDFEYYLAPRTANVRCAGALTTKLPINFFEEKNTYSWEKNLSKDRNQDF